MQEARALTIQRSKAFPTARWLFLRHSDSTHLWLQQQELVLRITGFQEATWSSGRMTWWHSMQLSCIRTPDIGPTLIASTQITGPLRKRVKGKRIRERQFLILSTNLQVSSRLPRVWSRSTCLSGDALCSSWAQGDLNLVSGWSHPGAGGVGDDRETPGVGAGPQDGEAAGVGQGTCLFMDQGRPLGPSQEKGHNRCLKNLGIILFGWFGNIVLLHPDW